MKVRLSRKLAGYLDGIDVSKYVEGDILELTRAEAELLIAEGWAIPLHDRGRDHYPGSLAIRERSMARNFSESALLEQVRRVNGRIETRPSKPHLRRRAEDVIREEHHDSQAKTMNDDQ